MRSVFGHSRSEVEAVLFALRPNPPLRGAWLIAVRANGPWRLRSLAEPVYARCGATSSTTEPVAEPTADCYSSVYGGPGGPVRATALHTVS